MNFANFAVNTVAPSGLLSYELRLRIYRAFRLQAENAFISSRCFFAHPDLSNIRMGDRSFLNHDCFLENGEAIEIGDNTCLGPGVRVLTTTHNIGPGKRRVGNGCIRKPVKIGNGCWIGAGVLILPGVAIADGCVIGAGALVSQDCEPNGLYLGVPAKRVRSLDPSVVESDPLLHRDKLSALVSPYPPALMSDR